MQKLSYNDLEAQLMELLPGESKPFRTHSFNLERLEYQMPDFTWEALSDEDELYMFKRKRISVRKLVFDFLSDVSPRMHKIPLGTAKLKAVRTHVCEFNKRHERSVKVVLEDGYIYVYEDLDSRESITLDEFQEYEQRMLSQITRMRMRISDGE